MRFSVYLKSQDPQNERAGHETSRNFAARLIRMLDARRIGQNAIQLVTPESWRSIKKRYRGEMNDLEPACGMRHFAFIPERMPPVDIPGVRFIPPKPKPWEPISASV